MQLSKKLKYHMLKKVDDIHTIWEVKLNKWLDFQTLSSVWAIDNLGVNCEIT